VFQENPGGRKTHGRDARATTDKIISCAKGISDYLASMDWQQLVSLVIVGAAAALLLRSRFRPRKFSFERDTHCGCSTAGSAPQHSIIFRARKGERPQIVIKPK
jgi:hypothetical protein